MGYRLSSMILAVVVLTATGVQAITIDMVPVGNPGNAGELSGTGAGGYGPDRICGAVNYSYNIGKTEVTAGQYTAFLNAVATTSDTYGLYNASMWSDKYGCKIQQTNSSGIYSYSVATDYANRPVNFVSFWDAARFTNWLNNGQGNGSTETGAYTLNGYNGGGGGTIKKNTDATWWVPSEDEWYKAAYHKNDGVTGNYFKYPTKSNTAPGQDMADASGNNANYYTAPVAFPIDSGKYTTVAGEFQNSASPYGTFDQGGNVWEWNDSIIDGSSSRGLRGGSFLSNGTGVLASSFRDNVDPTGEILNIGFRVASVPEPGSITLLVCGAIAGLVWWRKRK